MPAARSRPGRRGGQLTEREHLGDQADRVLAKLGLGPGTRNTATPRETRDRCGDVQGERAQLLVGLEERNLHRELTCNHQGAQTRADVADALGKRTQHYLVRARASATEGVEQVRAQRSEIVLDGVRRLALEPAEQRLLCIGRC